jgi:hypothetical protein
MNYTDQYKPPPHGWKRSSNSTYICCYDNICYMPGAKFHGTAGGYNNHHCRCEECTKAFGEKHYNGFYQHRYILQLYIQGLTPTKTERIKEYTPQKKGGKNRRPNRPII